MKTWEKIDVLVNLDQNGRLNPLQFTHKGKNYPITETGRRWEDGLGLHILAMVTDQGVFELVYSQEQSTWFVKIRPQDIRTV